MGDSAPPPKKMAIFCQKKGLEMPLLGQKQCFFGSGGQFDAPPTLFYRCSTQRNMCCRIREPENG